MTERTNAVDSVEDLARKGQHVRELTLEVDLLRSDVDVITACLRLKGVHGFAPNAAEPGQRGDDDTATDGE
jgi:hypothetical protein